MMKQIVICADDYGQNPAVGQAIRHLATEGRISATSCLVTSPYWPQEALLLKPLNGKIDVGLHLNLTEGAALSRHFRPSLPSLPKLMFMTSLRLVKQQKIEAEILLQLDRFVDHFGRLPDYIDGHLHVVHLPVVRKALLRVYQQRLSHTKTYIRSTFTPMATTLKAKILLLTGAKSFKRKLEIAKIPHNEALWGNYNFKKAPNFSKLFQQFLTLAKDKSIILCHPGVETTAYPGDPTSAVRPHEYAYLASEQFLDDCKQENVVVARFAA